MSDVTPLKDNIQIQAVTTGAAASEAVMQQIGGSINHLNDYTLYEARFTINGPYSKVAGAQSYVDGPSFLLFNYDIIGVAMWNETAGSSGSLEFSLTKTPVGGGPDVNVFSVNPVIPYTAGNNAYIFKRITDNTNLKLSGGCTAPTMAITQLNAGDVLHLNIIQKQTGGVSGGLTVLLRSR